MELACLVSENGTHYWLEYTSTFTERLVGVTTPASKSAGGAIERSDGDVPGSV